MTNAELAAWVKKNPIIVGCGVLSLGLAVAIYFRSDAIPTANAQLDEQLALASRYALNISNAVQLKEQLEAITAANKTIESRLVRASDIGINQQYFYKLETESGVKITDLRQAARPGAGLGPYAPIGFTVALQGDFAQILGFLRALEDGSHYCRVVTASCSGGRTGPVSLTLNLELLGQP